MLGIGLRLLSVFFITLMFAGVKLAGTQGVSVGEAIFWRQLMGLPVILIWLRVTGSLSDIRPHRPVLHFWRLVIGISAMALNYWAMTLLPLAEATTIGFAIPIFSTILAALFLREPTGAWRWGAVIAGFVGIVIVMRPGAAIANVGSLVALTGALCTASATIVLRIMARTESTGATVFWFSASSLIPLGIVMAFVAHPHSAEGWSYILLLSLAGAAAQICLTSSLRYAPVSVILPMDYFSLFFATLYGWLLFDVLPASTTWIGAPVIVAAGLVILWREHSNRRAPVATEAQAAASPDR